MSGSPYRETLIWSDIMKNVLYLLIVVVVLGLLSSDALGLTPIGPPAATLEGGQFALGFGYSRSEVDVEFEILGMTVTSKDNELDTYMANLIWGLDKSWEFQIDLGLSEADYLDGSSSSGDFAWGLGLKTTWLEDEKFKLGSVFAIHFYDSHTSGYDLGVAWKEHDEWLELQIAAGPSYDFGPVCLYGGPFIHFIDGEADISLNGIDFSDDFEQADMFGGFIGARFDLNDTTSLGIEYLLTGSADAFCVNFLWRF